MAFVESMRVRDRVCGLLTGPSHVLLINTFKKTLTPVLSFFPHASLSQLVGGVLLQISEEQDLEKQLIKYSDASLQVGIRFNAAVPSRLANTPAAPRMYCQRIAP